MKRIASAVLAVGIIAAVAYAAPDTEPWRKIYEQRQHAVPQRFDVEVGATFIDAGQIFSTTGRFAALDAGVAHFNGRVTMVESVSVGKCTLNGASPSVCTDTVVAGTLCVCTNVGGSAAIAANGVACDVSSTTLTATSANGATNVVNWHCF